VLRKKFTSKGKDAEGTLARLGDREGSGWVD